MYFSTSTLCTPPSCSWRVTQCGPGGAGEQDEHESAVCSCREEGQAHAGLHWQAFSQQLRGSDSSPLVLLRPHLTYHVWIWPLHFERHNDILKWAWQRETRMVRGLELMICVWSGWIGASSGEGKISLQSYLSSRRLCVKKIEPGSSLKKEKGWEAMAVSSCSGKKNFGYWEKCLHSQDSQTPEVTQRGCGISVLGGTWDSDKWDHQQSSLYVSAVTGMLEQISLEFRVCLWSHSVTLININSSWLKKQNNKITCFKNKRNIIWKQLPGRWNQPCHQRFQMEKKNMCMQSQYDFINIKHYTAAAAVYKFIFI